MATPNPLDSFLLQLAPMLTGDIDKKTTPYSPWLSQMVKNKYPDEMGHTILNAVWQRSLVDEQQDWVELADPDGTSNMCVPVPEQAEFIQREFESKLATKAVISPDFCIDDLKVRWKRKRQMGLVVYTLSEITKHINIRRYRVAFYGAAGHKVIVTTGLPETDDTSFINPTGGSDASLIKGDGKFPDAEPTSILTQGVLDHFHAYLDREGAGAYASAKNSEGNIYKLITSPEHSQWLRKGDAATREDLRNTNISDILLKGLGVTSTQGGFVHVLDAAPRRWKRNADAAFTESNGWQEIPAFIKGAGVNEGWIQNPEYSNTTDMFEDAVIFLPNVVECLVPIPVDSVGKAKFQAQNYQGDYRWLNIQHLETNPLGNIGQFYGRITNGFQQHHPEFGIVLRHQCVPVAEHFVDVTP
jgi:hypothetical protein